MPDQTQDPAATPAPESVESAPAVDVVADLSEFYNVVSRRASQQRDKLDIVDVETVMKEAALVLNEMTTEDRFALIGRWISRSE